MKKSILILCLLFYTFLLQAQHIYELEAMNLRFESPELLEKDAAIPNDIVVFENENFYIDFVVLPFEELSKKSEEGAVFALEEAILDYQFIDAQEIKKLSNFKDACYVLAKEDEISETPVFTVIIMNYEEKFCYDVTVYCENNDVIKGEKIVRSIKYIR